MCDVCAKIKYVRSSFKPKRMVSTTKPLQLLYMDLCGPMRILSRGAKRHVFVIVGDYSRFTWTLFLSFKDKTLEVFQILVKIVQKKLNAKVIGIRSDHDIEFKNSNFLTFCVENSIDDNFSAVRTPRENGMIERKNKSLEDMARTMIIASGLP